MELLIRIFFVLALLTAGANAQSFAFTSTPQCKNLVAVGDSITVGVGATNPYPANVSTALSSTSSNQGVTAAGWNYDPGGGNLTARAASAVDPLLATNKCGSIAPIIVMFAGTNDIVLGGSTGAQTYAFFQTYLAARISAGWPTASLVVVTMLPRSDAPEGDRTAYNNALVAGALTSGYTLARVDLDPNVGCNGCENDTTYYQMGGIHPNNTGLQIIANIICAALWRLAACPAY